MAEWPSNFIVIYSVYIMVVATLLKCTGSGTTQDDYLYLAPTINERWFLNFRIYSDASFQELNGCCSCLGVKDFVACILSLDKQY